MPKDIEPKLKKISDYLKISKNETFVIPEYQRMYSWNIDQCDKLIFDIENFMNESSLDSEIDDPYFFGTIIFDCSKNEQLKLIDGQQRTISFLLLLKSLLLVITDRLEKLQKVEDDDSENLKEGLKGKRDKIIDILFRTDEDNRLDILNSWQKVKEVNFLLENKSINELYKDELKCILYGENYELIEKDVKKIPRKQKDNKYTQFFRNFKFFYEKVSFMDNSYLNKFTKCFIEKCQIIEIRSWQFEQSIVMFNSLNSTGLPLTDSDIISAKMYYNSKDYDNREKFNEKWKNIREKTKRLSSEGIVDIDSILQEFMYINRSLENKLNTTTPSIRRYYTVLNKEILNNPEDVCEKLNKIIDIWEKVIDYPICKLLLKFNENIKIFFVSYLYKYNVEQISEENISNISICLIRLFTILELVDTSYSSNKFKVFLFDENIKFVDKDINFSEIEKDFTGHIKANWNKEDLKQYILDYEKNVLVYLNEFLYSKEKNKNFDFDKSVNIEHIMPSSGKNIASIRQDAKIDSGEEFNSIVNLLGNKILLEENINKSIGSEWFKTKKSKTIENKSGYKNSKYNIASSLVNYEKDVWTKEDIKKMNEKIADRILKFIFGE